MTAEEDDRGCLAGRRRHPLTDRQPEPAGLRKVERAHERCLTRVVSPHLEPGPFVRPPEHETPLVRPSRLPAPCGPVVPPHERDLALRRRLEPSGKEEIRAVRHDVAPAPGGPLDDAGIAVRVAM